ncbi:DUF308 domain-containing protein [Marinivivus vitaminiproducens]|uniref:DUF308 domain-containing protein n=1 Tax=Marinivivus vitaminiproducens TaxID=3035935 RepID=UPI0027AA773E|nr:DUF308 domain-containing protein [Geminicoccaceae bacterium SCSIO 64248]
MMSQTIAHRSPIAPSDWLKGYYFLRFAVSASWVALFLTVAETVPTLAAVMLIAYPAWDAIANLLDASLSGGLGRNNSQMLNVIVSTATAVAVAVTLERGMNAVLAVFGVWAVLSGVFQLVTAARRWKSHGAQWAMVLSGAQSALAGGFFLKLASGTELADIGHVGGYAAFGAFYFLVSAIWLTVSDARRRRKA